MPVNLNCLAELRCTGDVPLTKETDRLWEGYGRFWKDNRAGLGYGLEIQR
jgi:hypothetical protein